MLGQKVWCMFHQQCLNQLNFHPLLCNRNWNSNSICKMLCCNHNFSIFNFNFIIWSVVAIELIRISKTAISVGCDINCFWCDWIIYRIDCETVSLFRIKIRSWNNYCFTWGIIRFIGLQLLLKLTDLLSGMGWEMASQGGVAVASGVAVSVGVGVSVGCVVASGVGLGVSSTVWLKQKEVQQEN